MSHGHICCCSPRTWAKVIGRVQVALNIVGFGIFGVLLLILLSHGEDSFQKAVEKGKRPHFLLSLTYWGCLTVVLISLLVFAINCTFGYILIRGIKTNKTVFMRWWMAHTVVCSCWSMFYVIMDPSVLKILTMVVAAIMYGFGIYIIRRLIFDIEHHRKPFKERVVINSRTRLLHDGHRSSYRYTTEEAT